VSALLYVGFKTSTDAPPVIEGTEPTDFVAVGTIVAPAPTSGQTTMTLSYEKDGEPASALLLFDAVSMCVGQSGGVPCQAMSVTFDIPFGGRRVIVEGNEVKDGILVRKLYRLQEGEPELLPGPGSVFVSWSQAVSLIENCKAEMVMQTHKLDVYITLSRDKQVRTVEPTIDEVFKVTERTQLTCGAIPIATE
jgi:hypothetical protein